MGKKQHREVPKCDWCNSKILNEMPGHFRDVDVDGGTGRYGVCMNCGGTGIALPSHDQRRGLFYSYRFQRDSLTGAYRRLMREHLFGEALLQDRNQVVAKLEKIMAALNSFAEIEETEQADIRWLSRFLDILLRHEDNNYEKYFQECISACCCRDQRRELLAFVDLVKSLPHCGTAAYDRLVNETQRLEKGYVRDRMKTGLGNLVDTIAYQKKNTGMYEEMMPTYNLERLLEISESIEALFAIMNATEDLAVQKTFIALKIGYRDAIPHLILASFWNLYQKFMRGSHPYLISECPCQKMQRVLATAREKVFHLLSPTGSEEWMRKRAALVPHLAQSSRELGVIEKRLKDPILFEELLLLLLVRIYYVECGKPKRCYAEHLVKHLEHDVLRAV